MCGEYGGFSPNFGNLVQHAIKKCTQSDLRFSKNEESKRSKINENGVNWSENQRENWNKMLKNC